MFRPPPQPTSSRRSGRPKARSSSWKDNVPKLFVNGNPGAILTGPQRELCRTFLNQHEVTVSGVHFLQEDSPTEIGAAIADWYSHL